MNSKMLAGVRWIGVMLCLSLVGLLAGCALLGDDTAPSAPSTTVPSAATTVPNTQPTAVATTAAPSTSTTTAPTRAATSASSGTVESVRLVIVPADSEVRYRVREQLARLSFPSDAVGSTRVITGAIVAKADGSIVTSESKFQVDLSTLKSDEGQRDRFIKNDTLQTNRYQFATFVPTKIEGLTLPPPKAGDVAFKLIGDLTIRDVTKPVTWDVKGTVSGDEARGTATTNFTFAYFNLTKPNVFTVLSVEDNIRLEMDLHLKRDAGQ